MRLSVPRQVLLSLRQLAAARRAAPRACSPALHSRAAAAAAGAAASGGTDSAAPAASQQVQQQQVQQRQQQPPASARPALILGIESSCDDTGVAVVSASGRVLGESLASQADIHAAWGGVVPKLAQEAHEAAIDGCVEAALAAAGVRPEQLDAVAVTIGPGLSLCLRVRRASAAARAGALQQAQRLAAARLAAPRCPRSLAWLLPEPCTCHRCHTLPPSIVQVGVLKARQLAAAHRLPLIPVHHMEAHALVARLGATRFAAAATALEQRAQQQQPGAAAAAGDAAAGSADCAAAGAAAAAAIEAAAAAAGAAGVDFPFLCLLISGGHNLLLLVEGVGQYTQLGTTLDDALGECRGAAAAASTAAGGAAVLAGRALSGMLAGLDARVAAAHLQHPAASFMLLPSLLPMHLAPLPPSCQARRTTRWRGCWGWS